MLAAPAPGTERAVTLQVQELYRCKYKKKTGANTSNTQLPGKLAQRGSPGERGEGHGQALETQSRYKYKHNQGTNTNTIKVQIQTQPKGTNTTAVDPKNGLNKVTASRPTFSYFGKIQPDETRIQFHLEKQNQLAYR